MFPPKKSKRGGGNEGKMAITYESFVNVVLSLNATARAFAPSAPILFSVSLHSKKQEGARDERWRKQKKRKENRIST